MTANPADAVREALERGHPTLLRAMARNYSNGHQWDHLDAKAVLGAADAIDALTARVAASEMDAARWRWMWDHDAALLAKFAAGGKTAGYYVTTHDGQGAVERIFPVCDTPESAIDAAMQEPQP